MDHKSIFAANLREQMKLNGKSRKDVCDALGLSYFTFSDWVNGKKMPRMDKVEMLANYFGVLKSDLIEEKEKPTVNDGFSEKKKEFLERVKQMSDEELDRLDQILRIVEGSK